jgi:hypothetical protein
MDSTPNAGELPASNSVCLTAQEMVSSSYWTGEWVSLGSVLVMVLWKKSLHLAGLELC